MTARGQTRLYSLASSDVSELARLWGELHDFPASEPDAALDRCFNGLSVLLDASNIMWVGAVRDLESRDPSRGWRPRVARRKVTTERMVELQAEITGRIHAGDPDPQTTALVAGAGRLRAHLRGELVDDATWASSWIYNVALRALGIGDRLAGAIPLDPHRESYLVADRTDSQPAFTARERDLLYLFLAGNRGFHEKIMLGYGIVSPGVHFSPREQDILRLLLTDLSEKQIAERLGVTWRTAHQYVGSVLRKVGAKGRLGLIAHLLRPVRGNGDAG